MKLFGLLLILTTLASSCQPPKKKDAAVTMDSLKNKTVTTTANPTESGIESNSNVKDFNKFEMTFEYKDKELRQRLGVSWLTNDSIEFRLSAEDGICDTQYWGTAKNKYADMDPESDEDENGESYLASEYVTEEETHLLKLRISLDKDTARIVFADKTGEDTDCIPTTDLVLVKKNAR